ncbi:MAG: GntR family transcriptional regulator [Betaproteobacteria bacterium]|nr:GntR family transcriptional regulator [Betaproteobacteria bacterium]MDE2002544.1 GntR family transcriptional regulator [Betaproteobacteria bacterium]MDE2209289.1 GntR family transcriptional regulator [Betaproteobacteria bacterium]MDE2360632.1 GntR family transcriptional regulator [Betaproteobacteria bacterium]
MIRARLPGTPTFQPLYVQVKALIERGLESGEWKPGEAIPPEAALASRFGVALGTVRKAVQALAAENLVIRRQGKGTFVATHTEERTSNFRFLRIRRSDGEDEYPGSRLIDLRRARAGAEVARLLALKPGDGVFVLRRVLDYAGVPTVLDEITLPAALFRGMTRERYDAHRGSMYGFFETEFGVTMLRATERLRAVAADAAVAPLLGVSVGEPLLAVDRVTFTYGNRPVELRRGLNSTRNHHYWNELS